MTLWDVPADLSTAITINGAAATLTTTTLGQQIQFTFSGAANQTVTVHMTDSSMGCVDLSVLNPDGTELTSTGPCLANFNLTTPALPVTGTYTIRIDPDSTNVGSVTIGVTLP